MASKFQEQERIKQINHIQNTTLFDNSKGGGYFKGKIRDFVLSNSINNLFSPIREDVVHYFKENNITWWGGNGPTGHVLSSQIACLNHLFHIRNDKESVLAILNNIRNEFIEVLPIPSDRAETYIAFEVVSGDN